MTKMVAICVVALATAAGLLVGCGGSDPVAPTDYEVEPYPTWPQIADHKPVEGYVESAWRDPAYTYVIFAVDSRSAEETASPQASSQLARLQTTKLSGYRERGIKRMRMGGRPVVRWAFDVGNRAHIEYFFEECGITFIARGTSGLFGFSTLSESFREMAATIKANCSE